MRPISIVGIALVALGAFLLFRGASYKSREEVLKLGGLSVTAEESHPISPWVGGAALAAGVVLVAAGVRKKA